MYHIAILGATGAVGRTMVRVLEEREFPVKRLTLLATERSAGETIPFGGRPHPVQAVGPEAFEGVELALFSAGAAASRRWAPRAVEAGAVVVDNSSAFRLEAEVPLVVPEVNPQALQGHRGLIANPNCSTIQMVVALKPIYEAVGIRRIVVATYQAVSGTGAEAVEELKAQAHRRLHGKDHPPRVYPHPIAFNLLPHIGDFDEDGHSTEELKLVHETRKILEDPALGISATTVRVPVIVGHAEAIHVETRRKITAQRARRLLEGAPGLVVVDDPRSGRYPMPLEAAGRDEVFVGRLRQDLAVENGLNLWIVADNLRKGAATNAVQIIELLTR